LSKVQLKRIRLIMIFGIFKKMASLNSSTQSRKRLFLEVPFNQKNKVKAVGAKWDIINKKWYAPNNLDKKI
jgi:hypothetical protein